MREGIIPSVLGSVVTASGASLLRKNKAAAYGIIGFGAAHVVLGIIDLIEHRQ